MTDMKIGEQLEEVQGLREQIKKAEEALNKLKKERDEKQWNLMARMQREEIPRTGNDQVSAFISTEVVPTVMDWDKLLEWIKKSDNWYLFQRRISATAWRELCKISESGEIPGIKPFEQQKLNIRKVSKSKE